MDARLLAVLADLGKAAVHELAAKVGMDPREAAARLVALSGSGLPLLVGVECDPRGVRAALAGPGPQWQSGPPSGAQHMPGAPSGGFPAQPPPGGSGPHQVYGTPSAAYPMQQQGYPVAGTPSAAYPVQPPGYPAQQRPPAPPQAAAPQAPPVQPDPVISTWGPPQTASWARGDQQSSFGQPPPSRGPKTGRIGDALHSEGLEQEQLTLQLLEVQDPADYLFGAAGYRLDPGERAVVVHTEITNTGQVPFVSLPDNYLELLTAEGATVTKAPVSLTSRPPHKIGVQPGETLGGHTVYVLPDTTRVTAVRWSPRPEPDHRTLTWTVND